MDWIELFGRNLKRRIFQEWGGRVRAVGADCWRQEVPTEC